MAEPDPRDERIAQLEGLLRAALERIASLEAEVASLKAKVAENSHNSSRPPSSDGPGAAPRTQPPTGRKPGGQPGHKGSKRDLLPVEVVDQVVPVKPTHCPGMLAAAEGD